MDNFKTYKVEDNGQMTPMVNVWMTMEQYSEWLQKKNEKEAGAAEQVPSKKNGSPHENHAKPHFPGSYKARAGRASMSAQRMEDFLSAYRTHNGNLKKMAIELGIKPASVSCYKSIAIHNGMLAGDLRPLKVKSKSTVPNPPISKKRAKKVAELYEQHGDDDKAVADTLGVAPASAKIYKNFARKVGLIQ